MVMRFIEAQWSELFDVRVDDVDEWVEDKPLSRAYVPSAMVVEGVSSLEEAFERLTGISKVHLVLWDMEPRFVLGEDLDFIDIDQT